MLDNLETAAENKNWVLLNRDSEARLVKMEEEELKIEVLKVESAVLKAKGEDELDDIDLSEFDGEQLAALKEMLDDKREEFSWSYDDITAPDEDPMDTSGYQPRKSRRISDL